MKRALATAALTAAVLFAGAPLVSAVPVAVVPSAAGGAAELPQQPGPVGVPRGMDTAWGGACELPLCRPLS
ncbi:hypothetical protein [Kitasatospora sp. NPDC088134]|uniref:hypothetical protein n=1 Tax=Kitasatospora sp. NPDC088134 TaxID=3364071 RepID=UPI0037FCEED6